MGKISMIVATSNNHCIGKNNDLPWHLPGDLKHFKEITKGKVIIMGRKCYESIGKPLPGRINVVLTRDKSLKIDGCDVYTDLITALSTYQEKDIFIIGGSEIYSLANKHASEFYITKVMADVEGDIFLEDSLFKDWYLIEAEGPFKENGLDYRFERYVRLKK